MSISDMQLQVIVTAQNKASSEIKLLQKDIDKLKGKIGETQRETVKLGNSLNQWAENNKRAFQTMTLGGSIAFGAITAGIKSSVDAASKLNNALTGLRSIVKGTGNDFEKAKEFLNKFTSDGLVTVGDAATSLKNLLSRGFGLQEAATIMDRFKDSAAFGRQASLSLGEAIRGATEGLKNENSILVDNAGVTKNVSMMWKEYAESIHKSVGDLTLAEKRQAELNGIMKETQFQVGDAKKLTQEYSGQLALLNAEKLKLQQTIGNALLPALTDLIREVTPIVKKITEWVQENPKLAKDLVLITGGLAGATAAAGALGLALPAIAAGFSAMLSPITLTAEALAIWVHNIKYIIDNRGAIRQALDPNAAIMRSIDPAKYSNSQAAINARTAVTTGLPRLTTPSLSPRLPGRAKGGPVTGGSPYIVGEKGPELFVPGTSGSILPNNGLGSISSEFSTNRVQVYLSSIEKAKRVILEKAEAVKKLTKEYKDTFKALQDGIKDIDETYASRKQSVLSNIGSRYLDIQSEISQISKDSTGYGSYDDFVSHNKSKYASKRGYSSINKPVYDEARMRKDYDKLFNSSDRNRIKKLESEKSLAMQVAGQDSITKAKYLSGLNPTEMAMEDLKQVEKERLAAQNKLSAEKNTYLSQLKTEKAEEKAILEQSILEYVRYFSNLQSIYKEKGGNVSKADRGGYINATKEFTGVAKTLTKNPQVLINISDVKINNGKDEARFKKMMEDSVVKAVKNLSLGYE